MSPNEISAGVAPLSFSFAWMLGLFIFWGLLELRSRRRFGRWIFFISLMNMFVWGVLMSVAQFGVHTFSGRVILLLLMYASCLVASLLMLGMWWLRKRS